MSDDRRHITEEEENASWLKELGGAAVPAAPKPAASPSPAEPTPAEPRIELPPIERTRPVRPPFVPKAVWIGLGAAAVGISLIIAIVATVTAMARVAVPDVTGTTLGVARTRLAQVGLKASVAERRFSTLPRDQVIEQSPAPGSQSQRGDTVALVISGGSEEFPMPDVIGNGLPLAKGTLEDRGLIVVVEPVISETASDTVLSSTPAPGAIVRTGDTVRLQVATSQTPGVDLQPYSLQGVQVLIDPDAPIAGAPDVSMEVARRLGSLLEASGATVTLLRTTTGKAPPDSDRARLAAASTASVAVGLTVRANGQAGRIAAYSPTAAVSSVATSGPLAEQIVVELSKSAPPASTAAVSGDNVFDSVRIPWSRVQLGVASQRVDQTAFADPQWADAVARSLYTALGKLYGVVKPL